MCNLLKNESVETGGTNCKRLTTYKDVFETKKDTGTNCKNTRTYRDVLHI